MSLEGVHASGSLEKGDAQRPNVYEPVIDILQYTCAHIKVNGSGSLEEGDAQRPNIHEPLAGGVHYALGRKVTPWTPHRAAKYNYNTYNPRTSGRRCPLCARAQSNTVFPPQRQPARQF
jgi:hypothetical protein